MKEDSDKKKLIKARFAPSPTGKLHIGSARTALFNYIYTKKHNGKLFLRIEDTDQERSLKEYEDDILESLKWLGISFSEDPIYQMSRKKRHAEVAHELLKLGKAYKCYATKEEIEEYKQKNNNWGFKSPWRDIEPNLEDSKKKYAIRLKIDYSENIIFKDQILGEINVAASEIDDMVLLRSDATPTYMLAVIVDDHDMGITHVIRGADHLTNTPRQIAIYKALGWEMPEFAHIPLICGDNGAKLSKRHGATSVVDFKNQGYLPEALCNYLARLGWGYQDLEIFNINDILQYFELENVSSAPAKFDLQKLNALNSHYIKEKKDKELVNFVKDFYNLDSKYLIDVLQKIMPSIKQRAILLRDIIDMSLPFIEDIDNIQYIEELSDDRKLIIKNYEKLLLSINKVN